MNLDLPRKIQIQTINRCNYACRMCPYPEVAEGSRLQRFEMDLYERLLDELRVEGHKVRLCLMLQNEPLLDRRFLRFLETAHAADDVVETISAVSNGSVLSHELLDELVAFDRFRLTVSVNANDRQRYREVHEVDRWDQIHELFATWEGAHDRVRLSFVMDPTTVPEAVRFQQYWRARGYPTRLVAMNSRISAVDQVPVWHEVDEGFGHCAYPVETLTVLVDGRVILCCHDWEHSLDFGSLHDSSIREIWNQPRMVAYRTAALEGTLRQFEICSGCDYPTRSAQRLRLEAFVSGLAPFAESSASTGTTHHLTRVRSHGGGDQWPVAVVDLDEEAGEILGFAEPPERPFPDSGRVHLPIGYSRDFSFGDLEPVWCPAEVEATAAELVDGLVPVRIHLHEEAPQFRFFRWYCADWRGPITNPRLERSEHGEAEPDAGHAQQ